MILDKHVQESINYSYEKLNEYQNIANLEDTEIVKVYSSENEKYELFKRIYKEHMKTVANKLKNISQYNLNKIDGYTFLVNTSILQSSKDDELILNITISYDNKKVLENIRVKYAIKTPEYGVTNSSDDLINKIDWLNTKW
ncbi:hypothetical protein Curi_c13670 [Gottschalkia acidurici 9a]|uniref:Uncharacterized protein n=1 Tax=Gottschalkia acidurici (strain ATCC 7906 / DSM 604 / BCRC 14475 / CIP 104303 / KCTC 5404 / NCIMB 10678 / 9a) TaxID=1128398 RepID=K0B017_GOTA9|nr:hypothetical protein [Gottschalkia acidurici]AFS78377.1 hypothetical protein Curi_c13670 [Gottschalkia acidurici 9a]